MDGEEDTDAVGPREPDGETCLDAEAEADAEPEAEAEACREEGAEGEPEWRPSAPYAVLAPYVAVVPYGSTTTAATGRSRARRSGRRSHGVTSVTSRSSFAEINDLQLHICVQVGHF
ncbi:hypothetical protein GCM10010121_028150 [Streptomyces brasiliensis]|uniref:Uncharacterized protein n=1 Tax=Streptomyces brasiliensis TaxID=1954 RepID=A0A917NP80_9ACTN|nr:hypothetical protein GCM10010121_028150 [Streptomyces brasiliensis]